MCLISYLIGSVSSAVIVCHLWGLPDPRDQGSGNPGATNVLRLGGKIPAALTLLGDMLKGFVCVFIVMIIDPRPAVVGPVMLSVFLGHLYPIFFGLRGGKGVATAFGILLGLSWTVGMILLLGWVLMVALFHTSSVASLTMALLAPIVVFIFTKLGYALPVCVISFFIFWRHQANIKRLMMGTEPKIKLKKNNKMNLEFNIE